MYVLTFEVRNHEALRWLRQYERFERTFLGPQDPRGRREWLKHYPKTPSPWCAEIVGPHDLFGFERSFLKALVDYSDASRNGNRGVTYSYTLDDDKIYEIHQQDGKKWRRWFCWVRDNQPTEVDERTVHNWLSED
jgi:hypothetical protein